VPAAGAAYTDLSGTTVSFCAATASGTMTIQAGGTLRVADAVSAAQTTPAGPDCPSAARRERAADHRRRIVNDGTIDADAWQTEPFNPAADARRC